MNLDELAIKYGTDKSSQHHDYCKIYEQYLEPLRNKKISLIECGCGGYQYPDRGGESVRMWYEYFPHGKIISIDIYEKLNIVNDRTEFWQGSQTDTNLLTSIIQREAGADIRIFIDDASHQNDLTIETFKIVFPLLHSGDLYFSEDTHTSYWDLNYYGNPMPGAEGTTIRFFTDLTHQLNDHVLLPEYKNEYAGLISYIHFYPELVVIKKK